MLPRRHYYHSWLSQLWPSAGLSWRWLALWGKLPAASYRNHSCSPPSYQHLAMQIKYTKFFWRLAWLRRKIPISGIESGEPDPLGGLGKPHGAPVSMSRFLNLGKSASKHFCWAVSACPRLGTEPQRSSPGCVKLLPWQDLHNPVWGLYWTQGWQIPPPAACSWLTWVCNRPVNSSWRELWSWKTMCQLPGLGWVL